MKLLYKVLLAFLLIGVLPVAAVAGTLNPVGGNAWDLYVMGNGEAIFRIMEAVKLITKGGGFNTLLMVLATVGFFFLAIQAGFDPGKNLLKMFGFLISVVLIVQSIHSMRANVTINDPVTNYYNTVPDVPAIVAIPTSVISEVGNWMTQSIETAFSIPSELSVAQGGGYNLAVTMMNDAASFRIANPELKKSLAAYAGDCVIPAIALQKVSTQDLLSAKSLWDTYKAAATGSLFTRYYLPQTANADGSANTTPNCGAVTEPIVFDTGMGATVSCATAYACVTSDLNAHAQELLSAKASQWSKTGTMIPFEQRMQAAIDTAAGGQNASASGQSAIGTILQSAMVNETNGMFRQASVQSGDNETLLAASVAQAEAQQKSAWATGSIIFQNMMGYVYTVLQAFTFALVPIILIALMIPGMGGQIFVSFGQLLVWMTLWEPMLAIVNFLVMVFSKQTMGQTWMAGGTGGVTLANRYVFSEQVDSLTTTAQFMGTMVPLIAWGLVKGSMAFTEFIAHGIGNSFAASAGAAAASGNLSMGNVSMNNTSSNKFDTSSKSTVGTQETNMFMNAGAALSTSNLGGSTITQNNDSIRKGGSANQSLGDSTGISTARTATNTESRGKELRDGRSQGQRDSIVNSAGTGQSQQDNRSLARQAGTSKSTREGYDSSERASQDSSVTAQRAKTNNVAGQAQFSKDTTLGGGKPGGGAGGGAAGGAAGEGVGPGGAQQDPHDHSKKGGGIKSSISANASTALNSNTSISGGASSQSGSGHSHAADSGAQVSDTYASVHSQGNSWDKGTRHSHDLSAGTDRGLSHSHGFNHQDALQSSTVQGQTYQSAVSSSLSVPHSVNMGDLESYYTQTEMNEAQAFNMAVGAKASAFAADHQMAANSSAFDAAGAGISGGLAGAGALTPADAGISGSLGDAGAAARAQVEADTESAKRKASSQKQTVNSLFGGGEKAVNSMMPWETMRPTQQGPAVGGTTADNLTMGLESAGGAATAVGLFSDLRGGGVSNMFGKAKGPKK